MKRCWLYGFGLVLLAVGVVVGCAQDRGGYPAPGSGAFGGSTSIAPSATSGVPTYETAPYSPAAPSPSQGFGGSGTR